jgi:hypothetical protein
VPESIVTKLKETHDNNLYGEVIKILMITSSGAEGINLKNTRFVHIVEPYWHMVRIEQVIGRARRICSHDELPEELRTVKVFLYLSVFSEFQKTDDKNIELRIRDVSRFDEKTPVTTDETLFEGAVIKDRINQQILRSIKESAFDCSLYAGTNKSENLVCYGYGLVKSNDFSTYPTLDQDLEEKEVSTASLYKEKLILTSVSINGVSYQYDKNTQNIYDSESVKRSKQTGEDIIYIGKLVKREGRYIIDTSAEK